MSTGGESRTSSTILCHSSGQSPLQRRAAERNVQRAGWIMAIGMNPEEFPEKSVRRPCTGCRIVGHSPRVGRCDRRAQRSTRPARTGTPLPDRKARGADRTQQRAPQQQWWMCTHRLCAVLRHQPDQPILNGPELAFAKSRRDRAPAALRGRGISFRRCVFFDTGVHRREVPVFRTGRVDSLARSTAESRHSLCQSRL